MAVPAALGRRVHLSCHEERSLRPSPGWPSRGGRGTIGWLEPGASKQGFVLLVDDNAYLRRAFQEALERAGHRVVTAGSGKEALAALGEKVFDVVVTDVRMPDMTGLELLDTLCGRDRRLPVVLISGALDHESAAAAVERGAFACLEKPVSLRALEDCVGRALELRRAT